MFMLKKLKSKILNPPFNLFLPTAILLFVFSFVTWGQMTDIHLHDTKFVISTILFIWALVIIVLLAWAIYKLINKFLWKRFLTWFHVLVTLFILIVLLSANLWHDELIPPKRNFVSLDTFQEDSQQETRIILSLVILFLAGQLAFVLNIIGGLINKFVKTR